MMPTHLMRGVFVGPVVHTRAANHQHLDQFVLLSAAGVAVDVDKQFVEDLVWQHAVVCRSELPAQPSALSLQVLLLAIEIHSEVPTVVPFFRACLLYTSPSPRDRG